MAANNQISVEDQSLLLRQIIDSSPALLHTAQPDGYLDFFNGTWLDFTGEPLEKLLGWAWTSCIHPDDVEALVRKWRESLAQGKPFQEASRVRRADGVYRWMLHQKVPIVDGTGHIVKWHGSSVDIDDRKRAEERLAKTAYELQRSEFYLAEAQRLGHIGSWVFDPAGMFDYWSRELFAIYGLDPERDAPTLDEYLACVHPCDREFMDSLIKRMVAEGLGCDVTKRIVRPNGEVRYIRCVGAPVLENGALKWIIGNAIDVTEHELLIQDRRRREAYLAEAQMLSCTGSLGWRPAQNSIVWSDETYRIFEIDPAIELTLDAIMARVHPEDRRLVEEATLASTEGNAVDITFRLLFSEERVKHVRVVARPLEIDSDTLEFAGAVIDITEAKSAEETLRKSERELRTLIDMLPACVETTLPDGTVDFVSQSWLDYSGQNREDAMGWSWAGVIHPDDVDRVMANWQKALTSGEPAEDERRLRRADGVYHWFLNRTLPLRDDAGKILKWYGILFDIDSLKNTERALQSREHELVGIIETVPSMLWSTSPDGEVTHINQKVREYSGLSIENFRGIGWRVFVHPDDADDTAAAFFRAIQTGESYNAVHRLRRADGEYRWHHARGEPLRDPQGRILQWYGLSVDIDERKRAEDGLRDTSIKLAKASRLAIVAELAASIAHELNQPLMSILANAQAAKRWLNAVQPNMGEANAAIDRTIRDARAADETMQHIRALFKQESFDKKDVYIPDILREVVRVVQEDPKKRDVPIEWHFDEPLPAISIDRIQIQQVFINLILNAIEALETQEMPLITLRAAILDLDTMLIQVIDNGPGVDDRQRIFDAFISTKAEGMGIGLAVSRTIVEAHGGRLWAENNIAGGATFNVSLPLTQTSRPATEAQEYASGSGIS